MSDILEKIVTRKRERLAEAQRQVSLADLRAQVTPKTGGQFVAALRRDGINIIAEIKRRSPSKGVICADFDPVRGSHRTRATTAIGLLPHKGSHGFSDDRPCLTRGP